MRSIILGCLLTLASAVAMGDTVTQLVPPKSPYADAPFANANSPYIYTVGDAADGSIQAVVRYFGICAGRGCRQPVELALVSFDWHGVGTVVSLCGGDAGPKPATCPARNIGPPTPFTYTGTDGMLHSGELYTNASNAATGQRAGLWQGTPKYVIVTPDAPPSD